jgi:hypothetical protein
LQLWTRDFTDLNGKRIAEGLIVSKRATEVGRHGRCSGGVGAALAGRCASREPAKFLIFAKLLLAIIYGA